MGTVRCIERRLREIWMLRGTTYPFEQGANATAPDQNGLTLLHWASISRSRRVDLAWILVKHGADVTAKDHLGWTPSHYASTFGHKELARFLVEH